MGGAGFSNQDYTKSLQQIRLLQDSPSNRMADSRCSPVTWKKCRNGFRSGRQINGETQPWSWARCPYDQMYEPGTTKKEAGRPMPEEAALIESAEGDSKISIITILKEICGYCIHGARMGFYIKELIRDHGDLK